MQHMLTDVFVSFVCFSTIGTPAFGYEDLTKGMWSQDTQHNYDYDFYVPRVKRRPKPFYGYAYHDYANTSVNYDAALRQNEWLDVGYGETWEKTSWWDFMGIMMEERAQAILVADVAGDLERIGNFTLSSWRTTAIPNQQLFDLWYVSVSPTLGSLRGFILAVWAFFLQPGAPLFRNVIAPAGDLNVEYATVAELMGVFVTNFDGEAMVQTDDKQLFRNFIRINPNRDRGVVAIAQLVIAFTYTTGVLWGCDLPRIRTALLATGTIWTRLSLNPTHIIFIPAVANDNQAPSDAWIRQHFQTQQKVYNSHLHILTSGRETCREFDTLHMAYPLAVGRGMMWIAADFDYVTYKNYVNDLSNDNLLKRALPMDGSIHVTLYVQHNCGAVEDTLANMYSQTSETPITQDSVFFSSDLPARGCFLVDALWVNMLVTTQLQANSGNFSLITYMLTTLDQSASLNSGYVSFDAAGDRYFDLNVSISLRNQIDCGMTRTSCHVLQICTYFDQAAPANCSDEWVRCMNENPDAAQAQEMSKQLLPVVRRNQFNVSYFPRYYGCSSTPAPAADLECMDGEYYDPVANACQNCGTGTHSSQTESRFCQQCAPGTYNNLVAQGKCELCERGRFENNIGSTACRDCNVGYYANKMNSVACAKCSSGTFAMTTGAQACTQCEQGTYQSVMGTSACVSCEPTFSTRGTGSTNPEDCSCEEGSAEIVGFPGICTQCAEEFPPESIFCAGWGADPIIQPDYMAVVNLPPGQVELTIYFCNGAVEACAGGVTFTQPSCFGGTSGIACGQCLNQGSDTMMRNADFTCEKCPGSSAIVFLLVVLAACVAIIIKLRPKSVDYGEKELVSATKGMMLSLPLAQFMEFAQLCVVLNASSVSWPKDNKSSFNTMSGVFSLSAFNLPCVLGGGTEKNAALRHISFLNSCPGLLICGIVLACVPSLLLPNLRKWRPPSFIVGCNIILTILQTFFITILNFSLTMVFLSYEQPKMDKSSIVVFPYLLTDSDEAKTMSMVAYCALACWCFGTFCLFTACVVLRSAKPEWLTFQRCTLAAAIKYSDPANAWVLEDMFVKVILCTTGVTWPGPVEEMQAMGVLLTLHWTLATCIQPFVYVVHFFNDSVQNFCKICAVLFSASALIGDNSDATPIMLVVIGDVCWVGCVFLKVVFDAFVRQKWIPYANNKLYLDAQNSLGMMFPAQPDLISTVAGQKFSSESIWKVLAGKISMEMDDDMAIFNACSREVQLQFLALRQSHRVCLEAVSVGNTSQSKASLEIQKKIIQDLTSSSTKA